jgi:hypothetical protein
MHTGLRRLRHRYFRLLRLDAINTESKQAVITCQRILSRHLACVYPHPQESPAGPVGTLSAYVHV